MKSNPEVIEFMKRVGMYAPGVYEIPEVREVTPGHWVRSGQSSAYDVNFGQKAGAGAVLLLLQGKTGNTLVSVNGNKINYMPTSEAIVRREVDIDELALFESLGTCFGRKPQNFAYQFSKQKDTIDRHL